MSDPTFSVVIPAYNAAAHIDATIASVRAQTDPDFELIVINDGSTDGGQTERIALMHGDRVRYFCQPNGGVASAMNTAVAHMTGDFFAWLSLDFSNTRGLGR